MRRSFIKRKTSGTTGDNEWCNKLKRLTEWCNKWQRLRRRERVWERKREGGRERSITEDPKEKSVIEDPRELQDLQWLLCHNFFFFFFDFLVMVYDRVKRFYNKIFIYFKRTWKYRKGHSDHVSWFCLFQQLFPN